MLPTFAELREVKRKSQLPSKGIEMLPRLVYRSLENDTRTNDVIVAPWRDAPGRAVSNRFS